MVDWQNTKIAFMEKIMVTLNLADPGVTKHKGWLLNSLPTDKILDLSKLKAFACDNSIVYQKLKFALGRVENNVGKGENAGYQHFLLFPQCF